MSNMTMFDALIRDHHLRTNHAGMARQRRIAWSATRPRRHIRASSP
jgi:hypothetical protein